MISLKNNNVSELNRVTFCDIEYYITDDEALKLQSILDGMIAHRGNANIVSTPTVTPTVSPKTTQYVATKDFKPQYEIKEQTAKDGTKLFCISRKNGWTRAEKNLMNNAIKNIKGIKTIEVEYTDKNGKKRTFSAWGFAQKATAQKHLATLPTVITVDELNNYGK